MNEGQYNRQRELRALNRAVAGADRAADALVRVLVALVSALRDRNVRAIVRYALVAVCFFCFIGLIGGVERGTVSVGGGIVLGLLLIFIEIYCLK